MDTGSTIPKTLMHARHLDVGLFAKLTEKPWLPDRSGVAQLRTGGFTAHNRKVALVIFLAVVGVLFSLFIAAYHMRLEFSTDWVAMPEPTLLWFNSCVLIIASVAFERARAAVARSDVVRGRTAFLVAGALTIVFLIGQLVVWSQVVDLGYYAQTNPANGFFFVLTGVHAVHLFGGLFAWWRAARRMYRNADIGDARVSVDLCAMYWHFLLLVWLGMFAMLLNT